MIYTGTGGMVWGNILYVGGGCEKECKEDYCTHFVDRLERF